MRLFRFLDESEIECRVGQIFKKGTGLTILLYKTARTDAALLDETVGPDAWANDYKAIDGKIYCGIGIKFEDGWVWKWNTGSESNIEPQKGEASDAMKRAGFVWGIGAELYTSPRIFIPADKCNIVSGDRGQSCYDTFTVEKIAYDESGKITGLSIKCNGKRCFVWTNVG